jgi:hypothetical protein
MGLFAFCASSLEKCLSLLPSFKSGILFYWAIWVPCML